MERTLPNKILLSIDRSTVLTYDKVVMDRKYLSMFDIRWNYFAFLHTKAFHPLNKTNQMT